MLCGRWVRSHDELMNLGVDIFRKDREPVGRIVYDGSDVRILTKDGHEGLKVGLIRYVEVIIRDGVFLRHSARSGNCVSDTAERIKLGHKSYWDAVRDDLNLGGEIGGESIYALPIRQGNVSHRKEAQK